MICKDCTHFETCKFAVNTFSIGKYYDSINCSEKCEHFKERSKQVELPCDIGDIVYVLDYEDDKAADYSGYIFIMANNYFAFLSPMLNGESNPIEICNEYFQRSIDDEDNSGVIVPLAELFLTKEEAEAKLKELENVKITRKTV